MKKRGDNRAASEWAQILALLTAITIEIESNEGDWSFCESQVKRLFHLIYKPDSQNPAAAEFKLDDMMIKCEIKAEYEWERKP